MRGKGKLLELFSVRTRITPAYAGKRIWKYCRNKWIQDHPRLCGEKSSDEAKKYAKQGSPPPMRGKDQSFRPRSRCCRITPAYAGKSVTLNRNGQTRKDHPRLCGEKLSNAVCSLLALGSPPPMRGKVSFGVVEDILDRITPAYAGKSTPTGGKYENL